MCLSERFLLFLYKEILRDAIDSKDTGMCSPAGFFLSVRDVQDDVRLRFGPGRGFSGRIEPAKTALEHEIYRQ